MATQADHSRFLRRSLQIDGVASGLCGAALLLAAQPTSTLLGLSTSSVARVVGGLLLVYAAALLWNASRPTVSRGETLVAIALNAAWVLGSLVVVVDGPLTLIGNVAVAAVAAAVLGFAVLEVLGLRRVREAS